MRGKHWSRTTLMPRSKQTNKVIIIIIIIIMILLTQIYVVIEN
jgi:hypothetical protein